MNWNFFRKKEAEPELDPLSDLTLAGLKVGYMVDFDMTTWQVTAHNRYNYDGDWADEWELKSASETRYLECEADDEVVWSLYRKIPVSDIEGDIPAQIRADDDPPNQVSCGGTSYSADSSDAGTFHKDGADEGKEFINWTYLDETDKSVLVIEQWGENDFEAALGEIVEEYQFSSILPGS